MDAINRTFIGVRVPPELLPVIDAALLNLKRKPGILDMRWNQPSEYFLSLVTLGEISVATLAKLVPLVAQVANENYAFSLTLDKFVGLPNMIQPRFAILQLTGDGAETSIKIANQLEMITRSVVPPREGKPFHPHLVMGRIKTESEQLRVSLGRALKMPDQPPFGTWNIDHLDIAITTSSTSGVGYKAIETFPLRPAS
jgi:2'-5' RNA ligase